MAALIPKYRFEALGYCSLRAQIHYSDDSLIVICQIARRPHIIIDNLELSYSFHKSAHMILISHVSHFCVCICHSHYKFQIQQCQATKVDWAHAQIVWTNSLLIYDFVNLMKTIYPTHWIFWIYYYFLLHPFDVNP